jgi:hypothetical protein
VLKFGGEKALTKQEPVENTLKCQLSVEDENKVGLGIGKLVTSDAATVCSHEVFPEHKPKLKVIRVVRKPYPNKNGFGRVVEKLYNLESGNEPERSLDIELNLYQMEDY